MGTKRKSETELATKKNFLSRLFQFKIVKYIIIIVIIAFILVAGVNKYFETKSAITKIGFEDIGELATQSAYCTEISVTEAARDLFGITIPFTESKYIYSYNVTLKAGYDFSEIEWKEKGTTIEVRLPEAKILSSGIDPNSFKLYHEDESIYRQITLSENNEALVSLEENAKKNAIANGFLDEARSNAETILTSFFANNYDLNEYEIVFKDK